LDERRQRALTRYYLDAGAGGVAVGVHTTQFAIHSNGMLKPVLEISAEVASTHDRPVVLVAAQLGYHMVLLRPEDLTEDELLDRSRAVGQVLPVVGFYLQSAVGGRPLTRDYWQRLASQETVIGIKAAPFNRYQTLDVLHGVARSGRAADIALYTGNDNQILTDLTTRHGVVVNGQVIDVGFVGGLLGQWAVWTQRAVAMSNEATLARAGDDAALRRLLALDGQLTDANAAIFDVAHNFHGCIPGIHEVLYQQGLLAGRWTLDPAEDLSPGQLTEIDRVWTDYPSLRDDEFVANNLGTWLS
jgi:dihydrodipicolinate synthase/N-acetylneuraminate lyase